MFHTIPVHQGCLHAEEQGTGVPLVLLHAYSVDMHMWDPQWEALSRKFRVIRYDARGYGRSSMPEGPFSMVRDFTALLDYLKLERVHAVGLSMGANTLCDVLAWESQRLLSCTLIAGGIGVRPNSPDTDHARGLWKNMTDAEIREEWLARCGSVGGERWQDILPDMRRLTADWSCWQVKHPEPLTSNPCPGTRQRLQSHPPETPLLCIAGTRDSDGAIASMEEMKALCPVSRMVRIQGAGHFTNLETPDEVSRQLEIFLQGD